MHLNPSTLNLNIVKSISYIFSIILAFCFLSSCQNADIDRKLDNADAMLDQHPDSALALLQTIDRSSIHKTESTARYSILLFAAAMKNGLSVDPDSILTPAVAYYGEKDNPSREKMLTHFFYAVYLSNNNQPAAGIKEYDKAITVGEQIGDILYTGLAYTNKGVSYGWDNIGDEELEFTRKGLEKIRLTNDTARLIHALSRYGVAAMHNEKYELADSILKRALHMSRLVDDSVASTGINLKLASNLFFKGDIYSASSIYDTVNRSFPEAMEGSDYALWGECGILLNDFDDVEKCVDLMQGRGMSLNDSITWYDLRSKIALYKNDFQTSFNLKDSVIINSNKAVEQAMSFNLLHKEKEMLRQTNGFYKMLSDQRLEIIYLGVLTAILLIAIILLISIHIDKRRKFRLKMQEEELVKLRIILNSLKDLMKEKMATINNLGNLTDSLKNEIKDLDNRRLLLEKSLKEKEDELSVKNDKISKISTLRDLEVEYLNKMHSEICSELKEKSKKLDYLSKDMESYRNRSVSSYRKAHVEVSALICNTSDYLTQNNDAGNHGKQGNPYEEYIGYKALERLTREVNTLMENILHIISTEYDLSQREINIVIYSLAGFSYRAIALFLDMKPSTVSSMKTRLFNKIKVDTSPNCYLYHKYLT